MQIDKYDILWFFVITSFLIVILVGLIIVLINAYQKKRLAYKQQIETLQIQHEKNLLNTQLEIQENTFQQISREIHDNINLSLTLAKLQLNALCWDEANSNNKILSSSVGLIGSSIASLRNISKSLNSDIISSQGLVNAIQEELNKIAATGLIHLQLHIEGQSTYMDTNKELVTFRIIQESLSNILKHAQAQYASVVLAYGKSGLNVYIKDNGVGFIFSSVNDMVSAGHSGLKNIESRTRAINGTMQVETKPGEGTKLMFYIPFK